MGMSYELYWFGDTWLVEAYRKADRIKQERANENAWLQGVYHGMAISSTIGNAFLPKGSTPAEYPEEPIPLNGEDKKKAEVDEEVLARVYMNNMVRAGKNWGKGR